MIATATRLIGRADSGQTRVTFEIIDGEEFAVTDDGRYLRSCGRCGDWSGTIPAFGFVMAGVCFQCAGRGHLGTAYSTRDAAAKAAARRRRDRERAAAKRAEKAAEYLREEIERAHAAALREDARRAERIERLRHAAYAGEVGDKVTVTGTITRRRIIEPAAYGWSSSVLVVIEGTGASAGITAKMFTTAAWAWETAEGESWTVTGTVKSQETYNEIPQTVLARVKGVRS